MAQFPRLVDASLEDLAEGLAKGLFTSVDLVKTYIARIEEVNGIVHAVTEVNPIALDIAASLDEQRRGGDIQGPLHGIPVLIKNNIATDHGMGNTAGSSLLVGAKFPKQAHVARQLRNAGAIILGKANMSQWANYRAKAISITGWTVDGGQTLAAYHPDQSAGGSSSGSGVAVDLALAWAALGTETDGSVLDPAFRNGIVGIKPTVGLTSRSGVIPVSEHFDTVGPMARTVRDAAHVLQVIAGADPSDAYTLRMPSTCERDYLSRCDYASPLIVARIGVPWNVINQALEKKSWMSAEIEAFKNALSVLNEAGATIVDADFGSTKEELLSIESKIIKADFPRNLASYLSQLERNSSGIRTLADVRTQTQKSPQEGWPKFDTKIWDEILDGNDGQEWSPEDNEAAYQHLQELSDRKGPLGSIEKHALDAIAMPTSLTQVWAAVGGGPGITVPMGRYPESTPVLHKEGRPDLVDVGPGVPFGLCFLGRRWAEAELIGLAYGFEQRTRRRGEARRVVEPKRELVHIIAE